MVPIHVVVAFLGTVLCLQANVTVLAYITRDTLFLSAVGQAGVPYAILGVAALSGWVNKRLAATSRKYGILRVASIAPVVIAAGFLTLYLWYLLISVHEAQVNAQEAMRLELEKEEHDRRRMEICKVFELFIWRDKNRSESEFTFCVALSDRLPQTPANFTYPETEGAHYASDVLTFLLSSVPAPVYSSLTWIIPVCCYLWSEFTVSSLNMLFWELTGSVLDVRESKKYFAVVSSGATVGTLLSGFVTVKVLEIYELDTSVNLLVLAVFSVILALAIGSGVSTILAPAVQRKLPDPNSRSTSAASSSRKNAGAEESASSLSFLLVKVNSRDYLRYLCLFEVSATVSRVLVDFATFSLLQPYPEAEVKRSFGLVNGLQSCLMMPLQAFSSVAITRFGVMYGIASLPSSLCIFGVTTLVIRDVRALIGVRALYNAMSHTIFNTSRELLWLPLEESERRELKAFVTGYFRSFARITGALLSLVLVYFATSGRVVSMLLICLSYIWTTRALYARQSYAVEFYSALKHGYIDFTSPHIDITPDQVLLVRDVLRFGDPHQQSFILETLPSSQVRLFRLELKDLFFRSLSLYFEGTERKVEGRYDKTFGRRGQAPEQQDEHLEGAPGPSSFVNYSEIQESATGEREQKFLRAARLTVCLQLLKMHIQVVKEDLSNKKRKETALEADFFDEPFHDPNWTLFNDVDSGFTGKSKSYNIYQMFDRVRTRISNVSQKIFSKSRSSGVPMKREMNDGGAPVADRVGSNSPESGATLFNGRQVRKISLAGIFTAEDLLEVIHNTDGEENCRLRVEAIIACGYMTRWRDREMCKREFQRMLQLTLSLWPTNPGSPRYEDQDRTGALNRRNSSSREKRERLKTRRTSDRASFREQISGHSGRRRSQSTTSIGSSAPLGGSLARNISGHGSLFFPSNPSFVKNMSDSTRSKVIAAIAISLLRLSGFMDRNSHLAIQRLLHNENDVESHANCVQLVGKYLPEMISNGYLVYLLQHPTSRAVAAALDVCQEGDRQSDLLIPSLIEKLATVPYRQLALRSLLHFSPRPLWLHLTSYLQQAVVCHRQSHSLQLKGSCGGKQVTGGYDTVSPSLFRLSSLSPSTYSSTFGMNSTSTSELSQNRSTSSSLTSALLGRIPTTSTPLFPTIFPAAFQPQTPISSSSRTTDFLSSKTEVSEASRFRTSMFFNSIVNENETYEAVVGAARLLEHGTFPPEKAIELLIRALQIVLHDEASLEAGKRRRTQAEEGTVDVEHQERDKKLREDRHSLHRASSGDGMRESQDGETPLSHFEKPISRSADYLKSILANRGQSLPGTGREGSTFNTVGDVLRVASSVEGVCKVAEELVLVLVRLWQRHTPKEAEMNRKLDRLIDSLVMKAYDAVFVLEQFKDRGCMIRPAHGLVQPMEIAFESGDRSLEVDITSPAAIRLSGHISDSGFCRDFPANITAGGKPTNSVTQEHTLQGIGDQKEEHQGHEERMTGGDIAEISGTSIVQKHGELAGGGKCIHMKDRSASPGHLRSHESPVSGCFVASTQALGSQPILLGSEGKTKRVEAVSAEAHASPSVSFVSELRDNAAESRETEQSVHPLLLVYLEQAAEAAERIALRLCAARFPPDFKVNLIIGALGSLADRAKGDGHAQAVQEVLENLLPASCKQLMLSLLFDTSRKQVLSYMKSKRRLVSSHEMKLSLLHHWATKSTELMKLLSIEYAVKGGMYDFLRTLPWTSSEPPQRSTSSTSTEKYWTDSATKDTEQEKARKSSTSLLFLALGPHSEVESVLSKEHMKEILLLLENKRKDHSGESPRSDASLHDIAGDLETQISLCVPSLLLSRHRTFLFEEETEVLWSPRSIEGKNTEQDSVDINPLSGDGEAAPASSGKFARSRELVKLTNAEVASFLHSVSVFRDVNVRELLSVVAPRIPQRLILPGQTLISEGKNATNMFVVVSGELELTKSNKKIGQALSGQCVGETALAQFSSRCGRHPISAKARNGPVVALEIVKSVLTDLMENSKAITRGVMAALAAALEFSNFNNRSTLDGYLTPSMRKLNSNYTLREQDTFGNALEPYEEDLLEEEGDEGGAVGSRDPDDARPIRNVLDQKGSARLRKMASLPGENECKSAANDVNTLSYFNVQGLDKYRSSRRSRVRRLSSAKESVVTLSRSPTFFSTDYLPSTPRLGAVEARFTSILQNKQAEAEQRQTQVRASNFAKLKGKGHRSTQSFANFAKHILNMEKAAETLLDTLRKGKGPDPAPTWGPSWGEDRVADEGHLTEEAISQEGTARSAEEYTTLPQGDVAPEGPDDMDETAPAYTATACGVEQESFGVDMPLLDEEIKLGSDYAATSSGTFTPNQSAYRKEFGSKDGRRKSWKVWDWIRSSPTDSDPHSVEGIVDREAAGDSESTDSLTRPRVLRRSNTLDTCSTRGSLHLDNSLSPFQSPNRSTRTLSVDEEGQRSRLLVQSAKCERDRRRHSLTSAPHHFSCPSGGLREISRGPSLAGRKKSHLEKCIFLKGCHIFQTLKDSEIGILASMADEMHFRAGDLLYAEGDAAEELYIVVRGLVKVTLEEDYEEEDSEGENVMENEENEGGSFGELDGRMSYSFPQKTRGLLSSSVIFGEGDCLGEASFIRGSSHLTSATVKSLRGEILRLVTAEVLELAESHADVMRALLGWLSDKVSEQTDEVL